MGLYRTVSEINDDICKTFPHFLPPLYLTPPLRGFPCNFVTAVELEKTQIDAPTRMSKTFDDMSIPFHAFNQL